MEKQRNGRLHRGSDGRFYGQRRVNVESIPRLPATAVRFAVEDPRRVPFIFLWRNRWDQDIERAVVVPNNDAGEVIAEVSRQRHEVFRVRAVLTPMPRGGHDFLLVCPSCECPRRHLYAWARRGDYVERAKWPCRRCGQLRYISEGGGPNPWGPYPRHPIDPWVFSSFRQMRDAGVHS